MMHSNFPIFFFLVFLFKSLSCQNDAVKGKKKKVHERSKKDFLQNGNYRQFYKILLVNISFFPLPAAEFIEATQVNVREKATCLIFLNFTLPLNLTF